MRETINQGSRSNANPKLTEQLKSSPAILNQILDKYRNDPDIDEVIEIIRLDAEITTRILEIANSAAFSPGSPVTSLKSAVSNIGSNEIIRNVICLAVSGKLDRPLSGYGMEDHDLWRHSVYTAYAAERLGQICSMDDETVQTAFTVGLLHDIGKVLTNEYLKRHPVSPLISVTKDGADVIQIERNNLFMDHAQTGAEIIRYWNLPEIITDAIRYHHAPGNTQSPIASIVHLADAAAHISGHGYGFSAMASHIDQVAWERTGFNSEMFYLLLMELQIMESEIERMMGLAR